MIWLLSVLGIRVDTLTKEQAAKELLAREFRLRYDPVIVEVSPDKRP